MNTLKLKNNIVILGYTFSMGLSIILYLVFAVAFINDGMARVFINKMGEGCFEFFLFPVVLWFVVIGWLLMLRQRRLI